MTREIIVAGFGGQGVMSIGRMLAEAGLLEGRRVTWVPSYGPEMRGGTANCSVVISSDPIGSPVFSQMDDLIAMNGPSLARFLPRVRPGGLVMVNSSQCPGELSRADLNMIRLPLMEMAGRLNNLRGANMIMLGAYVAASGALHLDSVRQSMASLFSGDKARHLPGNLEALQAGADSIARVGGTA